MGLVIAASQALAGCTDPSRMFAGRWEARTAFDETWLEGRPELDIGHFGSELTGVIHYRDADGVLDLPCACAFIEGDEVDLDRADFVASTKRCSSPTLVWSLSLVEDENGDPLLRGLVSTSGVSALAVELELVDGFVPDDAKVCTE